MQKHKRFDWIISSMFKVMFFNFGGNIAAVAVIFILTLVLAVPYVLSVMAMDLNLGYPFADLSISNRASTIVSCALLYLGTMVIVPALSAGYFAPKTADYLTGQKRDKQERLSIVLNSFGRVTGATLSQFLILLIPLAISFAFVYPLFDDISMTNVLYQNDMIITIALIGVFANIVLWLLQLLTLFVRHIAFFEDIRGFQAISRSFHLIASQNFWPTLGELIVIWMIVSAGTYILLIPVVLIAILVVSIVEALSIASTVAIVVVYSLLGAAGLAMLVFINGLGYTGYEAAVTCLYFNARARTEGIPIPGTEDE